jgi:hypothetical protein
MITAVPHHPKNSSIGVLQNPGSGFLCPGKFMVAEEILNFLMLSAHAKRLELIACLPFTQDKWKGERFIVKKSGL